MSKIKNLIKNEDFNKAFQLICEELTMNDDFAKIHKNYRQLTSIPADSLDLAPLKVALVSTSTMDHFSNALKLYLAKKGFLAQFYISEFNTVEQSILNSNSELYKFQPDILWLFSSYRDIEVSISVNDTSETIKKAVESEVRRFQNLWQVIQKNSSAYILQNNVDLPRDRLFGNFEANNPGSTTQFFRSFNCELSHSLPPGVSIFDFDFVSSLLGKENWVDERYWYHSKHAMQFDAIGRVAFQGAQVISAIKGKSKKCLVLDLDNTLWGGVIGDDGLSGIRLGANAEGEAFVDFQKYILGLKERGIILAVCSKNEEENAKEPFLSHPDMILKLEDIAVFVANWDNKADNIRSIAKTLDIGLDSIVFVDDNPAERGIVRENISEVTVPDMPESPVSYIHALDREMCFETIFHSAEDTKRNEMYRSNADRKLLKSQVTNVDEYLKSLEMIAQASDFDDLHLPRITQLINKSNQFHLTTTRYSETEVKELMNNPNNICRYYKLKDRFGDNGLISVVILKKESEQFFVDTWLMSCRVLERGMERFVHNDILNLAQKTGAKKIIGSYLPTKKNKLVKEHYSKLKYTLLSQEGESTFWELDTSPNTKPFEVHIDTEG